MVNHLTAKRYFLPIAITLAAACSSAPAHARLEMELQSGAATWFQSSAGSPLVVVQTIGNFISAVQIGTTTGAPSIDLASVDVSSSAGGTLVVTFSANDFTTVVPNPLENRAHEPNFTVRPDDSVLQFQGRRTRTEFQMSLDDL